MFHPSPSQREYYLPLKHSVSRLAGGHKQLCPTKTEIEECYQSLFHKYNLILCESVFEETTSQLPLWKYAMTITIEKPQSALQNKSVLTLLFYRGRNRCKWRDLPQCHYASLSAWISKVLFQFPVLRARLIRELLSTSQWLNVGCYAIAFVNIQQWVFIKYVMP